MYTSKLVLIVCLVIGAVAGLSVPKTDSKKTSFVKDKITPRFGEASQNDDRGSKQLITTKFAQDGTAEEKCQCMDFYECDSKDVYQFTDKDQVRCETTTKVCCTIKHDSAVAPATVDQGRESGTAELTDSSGKPCTCVALDKCPKEAYVSDYGAGIIQIRISPCDTSEICCPNEYLKKAEVPTVTEPSYGCGGVGGIGGSENKQQEEHHEHHEEHQPDTGGSPSETGFSNSHHHPEVHPTEPIPPPPPVPAHEQIDIKQTNPAESEPECACVSLDLCKKSAVDSEHGGGILQIRAPFCEVNEVCCSLDNLLPALKVPTTEAVEQVQYPTYQSESWECGVRKQAAVRITGMEDETTTTFGEFPWMVMLLKKESEHEHPKMICGASLLSANVILTAAHCVASIEKEKLIVRAGEYDVTLEVDKEEAPHQDRHVIDIIIHPFYKAEVVFNDMALLLIGEPFHLKHHVSPICLPYVESKFHDSKVYDWKKCVATGWGKDAHGPDGYHRSILKKVDLSQVDHHECENKLRETKLGHRFKLHSSFICAAGEEGKDTCQGDGGGPLFCALHDNPHRYVQVGIVSWGLGCGSKYPAVYSSVFANAKWLTYEFKYFTVNPQNATAGYWKESRYVADPK